MDSRDKINSVNRGVWPEWIVTKLNILSQK